MNIIYQYWMYLIPLAVLQLVLMFVAIMDIIKNKSFKHGNMTIWLLVVVLLNLIGPILYFVVGKEEN